MCAACNIKNHTTVGSVVKIVRRCKKRTTKDKGRHLAEKQALVFVTRIASRGEGFYGRVINAETNILMKTEGHFRNCEVIQSDFKWIKNQLV
jgi:hypothetical protein